MLTAVEPETEADPAAVLLGWLTAFGNVVGRGAWVQVGADRHHPALFVGIVGKTSDAKGVAWGVSRWAFAQAESAWAKACICHGIGSGEGLVERVADEQTAIDKSGNVIVIPGASDKRCLIRLGEFSRCFKAQRRADSTLSEYLREAWDGGAISIPNRRANSVGTSGYAISVYGDITPGVIRQTMGAGTEAFDGFANRFLWCAVRSDRDIPGGGDIIPVLEPFLGRLQEAIAFGKAANAIKRDAAAERLWHAVYGTLKRCGDSVPHTDRARPYVVRLSLIYALADRSPVITEAHLRAALAVWDYCRASASLIFRGSVQPEAVANPEPLWLRLMNAITATPGVRRGELTERFKHEANAEGIGEALAYLERTVMAFRLTVQAPGGGRPAECWWPGASPGGDGEGDGLPEDTSNTSSPLSPEPKANLWVVRAEAPEETNSEETNSAPAEAPEETPARKLTARKLTPPADAEGELVSSELVSSGSGATELVTSFLPSGEPSANAGIPIEGGRGGGVNRSAFAHEPTGGIGLGDEPDDYDEFLRLMDAAG